MQQLASAYRSWRAGGICFINNEERIGPESFLLSGNSARSMKQGNDTALTKG